MFVLRRLGGLSAINACATLSPIPASAHRLTEGETPAAFAHTLSSDGGHPVVGGMAGVAIMGVTDPAFGL